MSYHTVAMLHNIKTDRFHPILFREAPQPSHSPGDKLVRSKSSGHHTEGFDTLELAIICANELAEKFDADKCLSKSFVWDGEGVPAMVSFFGKNENDETVVLL